MMMVVGMDEVAEEEGDDADDGDVVMVMVVADRCYTSLVTPKGKTWCLQNGICMCPVVDQVISGKLVFYE